MKILRKIKPGTWLVIAALLFVFVVWPLLEPEGFTAFVGSLDSAG